ncbi:MAG: MMPL family transporter [Actinobacteria bacterium]|nr:MAG: MMPL family transporter [Actinomycetota bacterium]
MFTTLGRFVVGRRRLVLALSLAALIAAGYLGSGVFGRLSAGGFDDPAAESSRAAAVLAEEFDTGTPNVVMLVDAGHGAGAGESAAATGEHFAVDDPAVVAEGLSLTEELAAREGIGEAFSYWSMFSAPPLRSTDGSIALVLARLEGDDDAVAGAIEELEEDFEVEWGSFAVTVTGTAEIFDEVSHTIEEDLTTAEAIAVPITLALLIVVFGGIVAAVLPVAVGVVAIVGALMVLWAITGFTDVSVFSINLVTAMGLGLAIDYSLFIVSRFREEMSSGKSANQAVVRTIETAGRTVAFSAVTVAVSLSALLIFPLYFLRSFAYAGIGVILVAMCASIITLPALLAMLGPRVDALKLWRRRDKPVGEGLWHRVAPSVMRRPVSVAAGTTAMLLLLGLPFLRIEFGTPDQRVLPEDNPSRQAVELAGAEFDSDEANAFPVVAPTIGDTSEHAEEIGGYAATLSSLDGVTRVDASTGRYIDGELVLPPDPSLSRQVNGDGVWFNVVPDMEPVSAEGEALVSEIRALDTSFDVLVGGRSAELVDSKAAIFSLVPWAAGAIGLATICLLFLMTGSVLVPVKAIVLNLLSLTATFGAIVWIFQDGNGSGILDFSATGFTDTTTPILMFCIAFGLSMDYEVFLLSRIKEEYDRTGDNTASVALGLERTGRIVTAAALLLSVTFLAFATSDITFIKLFGLGLAIAVLVDAFLVRATLVPAFMHLAGTANWWAPGPLRRLHERIGIAEAPDPGPARASVDLNAAHPSGRNELEPVC